MKYIIGLATLLIPFVSPAFGKEKPILERAWLGGEYAKAGRDLLPSGRQNEVYIKAVYPGTPAAEAGLQPADLILKIDGETVRNLSAFWGAVSEHKPGQKSTVTVLREGQPIEKSVTFGRETYRQWRAFQVGLGVSTRLDLWPDPDFSLFGLARLEKSDKHLDLRSPEMVLSRQSGAKKSQYGDGTWSEEGWNAWLGIFGFNTHKQILVQELVGPTTAMR